MIYGLVLIAAGIGLYIWHRKQSAGSDSGSKSARRSKGKKQGRSNGRSGKATNGKSASKSSERKHKSRHWSDSKPKVSHGEFHCVEVIPHSTCCAEVEKVQGVRFLSAEAPHLPLPGCDEPNCHCDFRHHEDRRHNEDRRLMLGMQTEMYEVNGGEEHRAKKRGRRKDD